MSKTETKTELSQYDGYDYKTDYWENENRAYEDQTEKNSLEYLLKGIKAPIKTVVDCGSGFGRLYYSYNNKAENKILIDYSQEMIDQAKESLGKESNTRFLQGNIYDLPLSRGEVDLFISIRTLHHIEDPEALFKELSRVISDNGHLILEVPNQRHFLNIIKFCLGKLSHNPFSFTPLKHGPAFLNYHPKQIQKLARIQGFILKKNINCNFCRSVLLKKYLPKRLLLIIDRLLRPLSFLNLSPSVLFLFQK